NSSRLKDESTFLKNYCLDDNCPTTIFKAGIYVAPFEDLENKNIEIYTRELRFTPLALLYAPGGNVSINAQKIENIWIDASGLNGEQDGFLSHENKVTFPKGRCQTTHPDWGKDKKNERQKECKLVEELVPPQDQPQDGDLYLLKTSGKAAGKISINLSFDGVVVDVPLLVSRGGDGADGLKGLRAAPEGQECKDSFEIEEGIHKTWQQKYIREDRRGGRES